jgi:hypothetical protein
MDSKTLLIGLDYDKTIAYQDEEHNSITDQDVIPILKEKVLKWIQAGHNVYLFTAKATDATMIKKLRKWLDSNGLEGIKQITNEKIPGTCYYVDDSSVKVEPNKGIIYEDPISDDDHEWIAGRRKYKYE